MKDRSKNKKNSSIDESTEILIHALVEQEVEEMENEIDPYEGYVQRVRMHIHRNTKL